MRASNTSFATFFAHLFADKILWMNSLAKQINACYISKIILVGVAQLVEHWVVASVVVGSSPIIHPRKTKRNRVLRQHSVFLVLGNRVLVNVLGNILEKHLQGVNSLASIFQVNRIVSVKHFPG
jgi:hypothetical protein